MVLPDPPLPDSAAALLPDAGAAFLERALALAGVSVWRLDYATGLCHMNPAGWAVVGMPPMPGGAPIEHIRNVVHPDDLALVVEAAEEARVSGRVVDAFIRYPSPDGVGWRTFLTRRVSERDAAGCAVSQLGVGLDMSRLMAERERADALAERARLVAEAMGVGFWSAEAGAEHVQWDESMYRLHRRDKALGPPTLKGWVEDLVHPEDRGYVAERVRRATAEGAGMQELVVRLVDGVDGPRWIRAWTMRVARDDGRHALLGMSMDVTAQQRDRARLERERERLAFAVQAAGVGIWERNAEGRVVYWNEVMYRQRGLDPQDPRGLDELVVLSSDPDDLAVLYERSRQSAVDGRPYRGELRVTRPDGSRRWLLSEGRPVFDDRRRYLGAVGVHLDVTEHKRSEALAAEKLRLEQASRDKSAFMARMSHELRTPLNAILGFARLIEDDAGERPTPRQGERLRHIRHSAAQLLTMIDDVLELARTEAGASEVELVRWPLQSLLQGLAARLAPLVVERGLAIEWPEAGPLQLRVDPALAERAVGVLLGQVLRCTPRGGRVVVLAEAAEAGETGGGSVTLAVLAPDRRRPEAQADLEAALACRWIEAMGGEVQEELPPQADDVPPPDSAPVGRWQVRLQRAAPSGPAPASPPVHAGGPQARLLYVEDNPVNLLLVRELLALRPNVRLLEAEDGAAGLALALAERPSVVLLDMQLPDTDGTTLMRRLRAEPALAGATFVAVSADAMPEHIASARAAGFDDYWTKPLDFERFLLGIDRLLAAAPADPPASPPASPPGKPVC